MAATRDPIEGPFRAFLEAAPAAMFVLGSEEVLYANAAAEELTGYGLDEWRGRSLWGIALPGSRETLKKELRGHLAGGRSRLRCEAQVRTKEGEVRWLELTVRRIDLEGTPASLAAAFDVTPHRQAEIALREKEALLKLAQRAGQSVTWDWDTSSDEIAFSESTAEIFPFSAHPLPRNRQELCRFIHPEDQRPLQEAVRQALRRGDPLSMEVRLQPPGKQEVHWILIRGRSHQAKPGLTRRMVGVVTDITDRRRAEVELRREKERAQVTLGSIGDGVLRTDERGRIDYMNPAAEAMTGWSLAEAAGRPLAEVLRVVDPISRQPVTDPVQRCLQDPGRPAKPDKDLLVRRDTSEVEVRHTTALIHDRQGKLSGAVVVLRDLSELRAVEREMLYLATHDGLTGLYNRTEFERRLARALVTAREEDRTHVLFYLDLDEFKLINDTCGHLAGDEMLGQVGSLLKCRFRENDTLGRLGGDELGVLLEDCPRGRALEIARDLCKDIRSFRFSWRDSLFTIGASVGMVTLGPDSGDVAEVLSAADGACYLAKERGGNRVHEYQPDDSDLVERFGQVQLVQSIHNALESQSFELHHQVVQSLNGSPGEVLFHEILVRMVDEHGELVLPAAFIPVAERHRLISAIDRWVVKTGLASLAAHGDRFGGRDTCFAVNLSGQSLGDESFLEFVLKELSGGGISPRRILFEITETASISHLGRAMHFISALRAKGCRFVLDDFGSGLSSFAYLRNLPVDFIKIDGQFVRRVTKDPIHRALVQSINHIGHVMQLKTIAEAVEDEETFEAVRRMKVDYGQGYWIAKPAPLVRE